MGTLDYKLNSSLLDSNKSYTNGTQAIFSFTIGSSDSYEALVITDGGSQTEITVSNLHLYKLD